MPRVQGKVIRKRRSPKERVMCEFNWKEEQKADYFPTRQEKKIRNPISLGNSHLILIARSHFYLLTFPFKERGRCRWKENFLLKGTHAARERCLYIRNRILRYWSHYLTFSAKNAAARWGRSSVDAGHTKEFFPSSYTSIIICISVCDMHSCRSYFLSISHSSIF